MRWIRQTVPTVVLVCSALGVGVALAGCGDSGGSGSSTSTPPPSTTSSTTTSSTTTNLTTTSSTTHHKRHQRKPPKLPAVGQTQRLTAYGSTLHVTVTKVIDPLPYRGSSVVPGTRPVGVEVRIAVVGGATYDSTASGDWSLQLAHAGTDATPLSVSSGVCETQLVDFESAIYGGDVRVVFSPHSNAAYSVRWR
jgi:hypothetical protein